MTTVEGDPTTEYVRVTPDGLLEIYHDATLDPHGGSSWEYRSCGPVTEIEPGPFVTCGAACCVVIWCYLVTPDHHTTAECVAGFR